MAGMIRWFAGLWLCLAAACCNAQSGYYIEPPKAFEGGLIAGVNFTQVDGDTYYGYHKIGFTAGGMVYIHFTEKTGISMEIDYTQKGSRGETITESPSIGEYVSKYFMDLNYAEVPITLHYKYGRLDFEAGLSYARLINAKEWVLTDQPVIIDPVLNRFNNTDIDYILGVSSRLYKHLYGNIRYQYSVIAIRPGERVPYGYSYGNAGQFNNLFNIRLIYLL